MTLTPDELLGLSFKLLGRPTDQHVVISRTLKSASWWDWFYNMYILIHHKEHTVEPSLNPILFGPQNMPQDMLTRNLLALPFGTPFSCPALNIENHQSPILC